MQCLAQAQSARIDRTQIRIDVRRLDRSKKPGDFPSRNDRRLNGLIRAAYSFEQLPVVLEQIVVEKTQTAIKNALRTAVEFLVTLKNERSDLPLSQHERRLAKTIHQDTDLPGVGLAGTTGQTGQHQAVCHIVVPAIGI